MASNERQHVHDSAKRKLSPVRVRISALALLKMAMHAKSGGNIEVMGMLQARFMNTRPP